MEPVLGRHLRPHIGDCVHNQQRRVVGLKPIFESRYVFGCPTKVHIDLQVAIGYISIHRDHDKAHFGENEIQSVISGSGKEVFIHCINFVLQIIDGFVG